MAYRANPFLERMSERTSDQEFVRLFSPKILEKLDEDALQGAVHIFRSPPGGGKTTLLRAFTPSALRAFWNARKAPEMSEASQRLVAQQVLNEQSGPQVLGILLSCASGYADLPPGAALDREGLFRALLDCRVVLRTLRSLAVFLGYPSNYALDEVILEYDAQANDLKYIPRQESAATLVTWAEQRERAVYADLDSMASNNGIGGSSHVRFESILWLQSVQFVYKGKIVAPRRLLMIDDVHKLRRKQRTMLLEELTELRPTIPVWLAERTIALGNELIAQGTREGRDVRNYALEDIWSAGRGQYQFTAFAQNILDRRLDVQTEIPSGVFSQYLRSELHADDVREQIDRGFAILRDDVARYRKNPRYAEWVAKAEANLSHPSLESLREFYSTRILLSRDAAKKQMSLELVPLAVEVLDQRDSSQVGGAAEIFLHEELGISYYFGLERLCVMATNNVEELLFLAARLYDALRAKQILRKGELVLSPKEQEKLLKENAAKKREFIPKNHTEGNRGQRLLDAIGSYCRERTFLPNAPYAPGVTGIRLSMQELGKLNSGKMGVLGDTLTKVLAECAAENLLVCRPSAASTSRDGGTVFYLNRTLCAYYDLPLQTGGWQDVDASKLVEWMERSRIPSKLPPLGGY
jgi:hypothetical protein